MTRPPTRPSVGSSSPNSSAPTLPWLALRRALHCLASSCLALPCDVPCPALARLASRRLSLPCLAHAIFKKLSSDHLYTLSDSRLVFLPGATLPCLLPCPALPPGALPWLLVPCPDLPPRTLPWLAAWRLPLSCLAQDVLKKLSCDHLHSLSDDWLVFLPRTALPCLASGRFPLCLASRHLALPRPP